MQTLKQILAGLMVRGLGQFGYTIAPLSTRGMVPIDLPADVVRLVSEVGDYTKTSPERIYALYEAVRYVERRRVPGAIVECGVWRGGSMMAAAKTLLDLRSTSRDFYLFDTFSGMTEPSSLDRDLRGASAAELLERSTKASNIWAYAPLDDVRRNMAATGYPIERMHFIVGRVEDTLPAGAPEQIAILRLDTDWYESTRHELRHLVPRMADGGVLIIDDYGHWQGARQAVDEYFATDGPAVLLNRVDYTGRVCVITRPELSPVPAAASMRSERLQS
jgi:hypothetical protein